MRGSPLLQTILLVAVLLLAGVPVYRLTRPARAAATAGAGTGEGSADPPGEPAAPLEVEVTCAPAATDFQLKNLDQTVLAGRGPQARFHARWTTAVPPEGVDLVIQAHWPTPPPTTGGASPAAARVSLRFADGRQVEKSFWAGANGTLTEVFTVPGKTVAATP